MADRGQKWLGTRAPVWALAETRLSGSGGLQPRKGKGAMRCIAVQKAGFEHTTAHRCGQVRAGKYRLCPVRPLPYSTVNSFWLSSGRRFLPVPLLAMASAQAG